MDIMVKVTLVGGKSRLHKLQKLKPGNWDSSGTLLYIPEDPILAAWSLTKSSIQGNELFQLINPWRNKLAFSLMTRFGTNLMIISLAPKDYHRSGNFCRSKISLVAKIKCMKYFV